MTKLIFFLTSQLPLPWNVGSRRRGPVCDPLCVRWLQKWQDPQLLPRCTRNKGHSYTTSTKTKYDWRGSAVQVTLEAPLHFYFGSPIPHQQRPQSEQSGRHTGRVYPACGMNDELWQGCALASPTRKRPLFLSLELGLCPWLDVIFYLSVCLWFIFFLWADLSFCHFSDVSGASSVAFYPKFLTSWHSLTVLRSSANTSE